MKTLDHAVRLGVVARCAISDYTKLITQIIPRFRFELCASIRGYGSRRAKTSYPSAEESIGDRFFISTKGRSMASGQCVKWSTQVSEYLYPSEYGKGPTMST